jgi:hypothetical protein
MHPCKVGLKCSAAKTCQKQLSIAPGATCDDDLAVCAKGLCPAALGPISDGGTSVCPTVIADGQSCIANDASRICDDYAFCVNGTCQLFDVDACK